jgi:hypothetical protein
MADGDTVRVGASHSGTSTTKIANTTNSKSVFRVQSNSGYCLVAESKTGTAMWGHTSTAGAAGVSGTNYGGGSGVHGTSASGNAVYGDGVAGRGVMAESESFLALEAMTKAVDQPALRAKSGGNSTGVMGFSGKDIWATPPAAKSKTGVYGHAVQDSASRGVWGRSNAGRGVFGEVTTGVGLFGIATTGHALATSGRVRLEKVSGVATLSAGSTSIVVTPGITVGASAFVLLTPRTDLEGRSYWYTTDPANSSFTIHIGSARALASPFVWLLVETGQERISR